MTLDEEVGDAENVEDMEDEVVLPVGEVAEADFAKLDVPCLVRDCGAGAYKVSLPGSM